MNARRRPWTTPEWGARGQRFLFLVLALLVLVPAGLAWLTLGRLGGPTMTTVLSSPFRDAFRWWTAVLAAEVLVFNALNSFLGSDPGRRALCFGVAAAMSVVLQLSVRPYADERLPVNALQTLCKVSWVVLAFLGTPTAMAGVFGASLAQTARGRAGGGRLGRRLPAPPRRDAAGGLGRV